MECKKCGTQICDDGVFCSKCGARADGKMECKNCAKLISDDSTYCTYCGTRVDGKKVCSKCGTVFDGEFCSNCGTQVASKKSAKAKIGTGVFAKVEKWVSPSLLLGAMIITFICSFFVGAYMELSGVREEGVGFYFFGECFEEIKLLLNSLSGQLTDKNLNALNGAFSAPYVIAAIFVGLNILISAMTLVTGIIEYVKSSKRGVRACITKHASISFAFFVITATYVLAMTGASLDVAGVELMKYGMTVGSLLGIILPSVLIFGALVMTQIDKGKSIISSQSLKKMIPLLCMIVIIPIFISVSPNFLGMKNTIVQSGIKVETSMNLSAITCMALSGTAIIGLGKVDKLTPSLVDAFYINSILGLIIFIIMLVASGILLYFVLNAALDTKTRKNGIFIFSIASAVSAIAQFVLSIINNVSCSRIATAFGLSTSYINTVGILIVGIIVLGAGITYFVLCREKKKVESQSFSEFE